MKSSGSYIVSGSFPAFLLSGFQAPSRRSSLPLQHSGSPITFHPNEITRLQTRTRSHMVVSISLPHQISARGFVRCAYYILMVRTRSPCTCKTRAPHHDVQYTQSLKVYCVPLGQFCNDRSPGPLQFRTTATCSCLKGTLMVRLLYKPAPDPRAC